MIALIVRKSLPAGHAWFQNVRQMHDYDYGKITEWGSC
jgi:hypothetical protein